MIPFMLPLLGAGIGALTNKKPLKGAAIGAGLGGLGMMAAPAIGGAMGGMLGAAPAAAGATGAAASGVIPAAGGGSLLLPQGLASAAQPGLLSQVAGFAKPIGAAASAASSVNGLLGPSDSPMQAPPPMAQTGTGAQTLGMLAGQNQQGIDAQLQMAEMERAKRRQGFGRGLL